MLNSGHALDAPVVRIARFKLHTTAVRSQGSLGSDSIKFFRFCRKPCRGEMSEQEGM